MGSYQWTRVMETDRRRPMRHTVRKGLDLTFHYQSAGEMKTTTKPVFSILWVFNLNIFLSVLFCLGFVGTVHNINSCLNRVVILT